MNLKEDKVVLITNSHTYEFDEQEHLKKAFLVHDNGLGLQRFAHTIYDKKQQLFVKCRTMLVSEINELLELTRG